MGGQFSLIASLVLTLLVLLPGKGWADEVDEETGLTYTVENNEATITGVENVPSSGELKIPASVGGLYTVKAIADKAFMLKMQITKVTFDERSQLEKIGNSAFDEIGVTEIEIPSSVTDIDRFAFDHCQNLTKVTFNSYEAPQIDNEVGFFTILGSENFAIYVPDNVVDNYKYSWPIYKDYIKPISEASDIVETDNGIKLQLDKDHHAATIMGVSDKYYYPTLDLSKPVTYYGTQYTITAIGDNAFMNSHFSVVKIPSSVTTIGSSAFENARGYYGSMQVHFAYDGDELSGYDASMFTGISGIDLYIVVPSTNEEAYKTRFKNQAANIYVNRNDGSITDDSYSGRGYYQDNSITYTRQLTEAEQNGGYVTCCLPFMIDPSLYKNMVDAIYVIDYATITKKADGRYYLTLADKTSIESYISPKQPMLLKLKAGVSEIKFTNASEVFLGDKFDEYPTEMTVKDEDGNTLTDVTVKLCGSKEKKTDCTNIYSFNPDGTFGKHMYDTLNPFRMYLEMTMADGSSVQNAVFYSSINPGAGTTAISGIHADAAQKSAAIYSIDGKKVSDSGSTAGLAKGVYIQNGKKIVVK